MKTPPLVSRTGFFPGHAIEFSKDRSSLFRRGYAEHGKIFSIRIGTTHGVVFADPSLASFFYKETDHSLNMDKPLEFVRRAVGEVSFLASHEKYLLHRPVINAPFTREKLNKYTQIMHRVVQKWLDDLPDSGEMELTAAVNELVQEVAGRCILGDEVHDQLGTEFWKHYLQIGQSLDPILPSYLPFPKFIRRNQSRKALRRMLKPIILVRKNNLDNYSDVLQDIITSPLADGSNPDDELILSAIIALLFAGHETTTGQTGWTIIQILQHPWYKDLIEKEIKEKLPLGKEPETNMLMRLNHVRWAINETTRLHPSADVTIRVAEKDLNVEGFHIPKKTPVFLAVEQLQSVPEIFKSPDTYDPLRFSPSRSEQKKAKHCIAGFGGGMHKCIGMGFAMAEMNILTTLLFQQFEIELLTLNPTSTVDYGAKRPEKTFIRFKRRSMNEVGLSPNSKPSTGCPFNH